MPMEYPGANKLAPGVYQYPGESIHIADEAGEVVMWNADEVAEDGAAFTAAVAAAVLAATRGPGAVRRNIETQGEVLREILVEAAYDDAAIPAAAKPHEPHTFTIDPASLEWDEFDVGRQRRCTTRPLGHFLASLTVGFDPRELDAAPGSMRCGFSLVVDVLGGRTSEWRANLPTLGHAKATAVAAFVHMCRNGFDGVARDFCGDVDLDFLESFLCPTTKSSSSSGSPKPASSSGSSSS